MIKNSKSDWRTLRIGARKFVRLIVNKGWADMILSEGVAESDGAEMVVGVVVSLPPGLYALSTHRGALFNVKGDVTHYVASYIETNNAADLAVNIHACLELIRNNEAEGPRVMICGSNGFGKTQLSRTLVNYRLRMHKKILYIDAELKYKDICMPGSISAMVVTEPYDIMDGWNILDDSVTYNFGHVSGMKDIELYTLQLRTLAQLVDQKLQNDNDLAKSGLILNLDSLNGGDSGPKDREDKAIIIKECIEMFQIKYVFVIEDEFLHIKIKENLSPKIKVYRIPILTQSLTPEEEQVGMFGKIASNYFTGQGNFKIQLKSFILHSEKFHIYRLDLNSEQDNRLTVPTEMPFSVKLTNSFLAVSQAKTMNEIALMPIYGYIMVIGVIKNNLIILTPAAALLPSTILLYTYIKTPSFY